MTDTAPNAVDSSLHDGLSVDQVLGGGAIAGLLGWIGTQYVARNPGRALETVGVEGTVVVIAFWALTTVTIAGVTLGAGSRAVKYGPPFWLWGVLVAVALTSNVAVVTGLVPESIARYGLWHPWIVVYTSGYLVMGIVAVERSRIAYLAGSLFAGLVLAAWIAFPLESRSWVFELTGLVHAAPLAADVVLTSTDPDATEQPIDAARNP